VLKGLPLVGNATVGLLCAATLLYGALAAGRVTAAVGWATTMTFLFVFAQEVFYTVEDEDGDRRSSVATTATRLGTARALRAFEGLAALFVAATLGPWLAGVATDRYLYAVVPCTIAPTLAVVWLLRRPLTASTIDRASRLTRVVWFSSVVSVALLR
jgi:geranylgeranylglycerol-phosphate geranylgeranyltransferase